MPVGIITSRTRGLYERPPDYDFVLNSDCDSAQGLVAFWPLSGTTKGRELDYSSRRNFPLTRTGQSQRASVPDGGFGWLNAGNAGNYLNTVATPPVVGFPFTFNAYVLPRTSTEYGAQSGLIHIGNSAGNSYCVLIYDGANGEGKGSHRAVVDLSGAGNGVFASTTSLASAGNVGMLSCVARSSSTGGCDVYLNAGGLGQNPGVLPVNPSGWDRYTVGAYRDSTTFSPLNGLMWWATIHNVAKSAGQIQRMYDPKYRYELAYPIGRRTYSVSVAGIAFDAVSNSGAQVAQSLYSWSHTCTGSNRFLAVDISLLSAGATVTSITYNGVALSPISGASGSTVTSFGRVECWGLANPASGTNGITVTLSGSITSVGSAVSYAGVHQTTPTEAGSFNQATNVGSATDAAVAVTSVADQCWIHAAISVNDASVTAGQTTRNNVVAAAAATGADEDFGPQSAGAKTMNYTALGITSTWAIAGYAIRPVGAASVGTFTKLLGSGGLAGIGSGILGPGGLVG